MVKQLRRRNLRCQCKRTQGIHDQVDPEQLKNVEGHTAADKCSDKGYDERDKVDCELELEKLPDRGEHTAAPQHRPEKEHNEQVQQKVQLHLQVVAC